MKALGVVLFLCCSFGVEAKCVGRFINPITDVCWSCLFPMGIGGINVVKGEDTPNPSSPICLCPRPPLPIMPGLSVSFWEPVRLLEITRTPYCLVTLGGIEMIKNGIKKHGTVGVNGSGQKRSFYNVHYYIYPLIYWLELLTDFICMEKASFDVAYLTELDPLWDDDATSFILNPEAVLFNNPLAQATCAIDCGTASTGFGNQAFFWCAGCQGSMYPLTGTVSAHSNGIQASLLLTQRMLFKLHRQAMAYTTSGSGALCQKQTQLLMNKTQYKTQMVYPKPKTKKGCYPLGRSDALWGSGHEFPYNGEDFAYLIWRKRNCCVF